MTIDAWFSPSDGIWPDQPIILLFSQCEAMNRSSIRPHLHTSRDRTDTFLRTILVSARQLSLSGRTRRVWSLSKGQCSLKPLMQVIFESHFRYKVIDFCSVVDLRRALLSSQKDGMGRGQKCLKVTCSQSTVCSSAHPEMLHSLSFCMRDETSAVRLVQD
jgi:hypothetical protein